MYMSCLLSAFFMSLFNRRLFSSQLRKALILKLSALIFFFYFIFLCSVFFSYETTELAPFIIPKSSTSVLNCKFVLIRIFLRILDSEFSFITEGWTGIILNFGTASFFFFLMAQSNACGCGMSGFWKNLLHYLHFYYKKKKRKKRNLN